MTNHVHLLMTPHKGDGFSKAMQSLGRRYVVYINQTYRRTGTLWEGRYKAALIDSERYLLTCYRYIELNPVRAEGMVEHPGEYRWSSYRANGLGETDELLTPHPQYLALGTIPQERQRTYRALFDTHVDEHSLSAIRESLNQCRVLGSEIFKDQIEHELKRRVRPGKPGRPKKTSV
jgi:putative transposase